MGAPDLSQHNDPLSLRLSFADLLTASIKPPILLLAKASMCLPPRPHPHRPPLCHFSSNQIMTDRTEKKKKGGWKGGKKKKKSHDFHMNSFDCAAHSQLYAGKNIGGSPELHLTDSSRLLRGRVKCHHKSSTQVTHRRVGDNASSSAQEDAHENASAPWRGDTGRFTCRDSRDR